MISFDKEGETPLDDIIPKITTRAQLDSQEAKSILNAFLEGNGRWARLVTDIWLASQARDTLEWGNDNLVDINDDRSEYILALQEADKGDLNRLQGFMFPEI